MHELILWYLWVGLFVAALAVLDDVINKRYAPVWAFAIATLIAIVVWPYVVWYELMEKKDD